MAAQLREHIPAVTVVKGGRGIQLYGATACFQGLLVAAQLGQSVAADGVVNSVRGIMLHGTNVLLQGLLVAAERLECEGSAVASPGRAWIHLYG